MLLPLAAKLLSIENNASTDKSCALEKEKQVILFRNYARCIVNYELFSYLCMDDLNKGRIN